MTTSKFSIKALRCGLWALASFAALGLGAALVWQARAPQDLPATRITGEAAITNAYALTDQTGRAVTAETFAGQWQLVFFGFTYCPDICPTTLAYLASVMDLLGDDAKEVAPIFITVDPQRDTVGVMADYVTAFHPALIGLTGTEAQVAEAATNFRVFYERAEEEAAPDGYMMAHSGYIYLMHPDGRFEAVFREGDQPPEVLTSEISMRIEKENRDR